MCRLSICSVMDTWIWGVPDGKPAFVFVFLFPSVGRSIETPGHGRGRIWALAWAWSWAMEAGQKPGHRGRLQLHPLSEDEQSR